MSIIYIAGPFRGDTPTQERVNILRAETLAAWAASRREGITRADAGIAYVREWKGLRSLDANLLPKVR